MKADPDFMPNDPYFTSGGLWGLHNTGQSGGKVDADIDAPEAWGINRGSSTVIVAVLDSGVDLDHPDFSGRLTSGWDFVNNDNNPNDDQGHGTHVAGTVAARGNNSLGVVGVAMEARVMPVKVLDSSGSGSYYGIIQGINYATNNNADVINMSLGGTSYSSALQDAINRAYNNGVLVVASSGNCGDSYYYFNGCSYQDQTNYPGAMNHVLAVASTTRTDAQSSFSTQGYYVDIAAPGSTIWSTCMGGGYCTKSGTSMASPHVAGLAALISSQYPAYSPDQVARAIVHNADDLGSSGHDQMFGCGRINAYKSLTNGAVTSGCGGWGGLSITSQPHTINEEAPYQPGVLLVTFAEGSSQSSQEALLSTEGLVALDVIESLGIYMVSVPVGEELNMMAQLEENAAVAHAEPNFLVQALP
jgi:subtilisin family serine protease